MSAEEIVQEDVVEAPEGVEAEATEEVVSEEISDQEEPATPDDVEKPKRRSRAEERINALTKEKYDAQRQAEEYQRQLAEYQRQLQQQQAPQPEDMPKLSDFDYDEGRYQQAVQAWAGQKQQSFYENLQRQQQDLQTQAEQQRQAQVLQQKVSAGVQKYPDFQAKVFDPNLPPLRDVNPAAFQAVIESDVAEDVAYYLASNPQEVYSFASLTPIQAVRKVAQIEGRLSQKPTSRSVPPKPPTRVSGNSEAVKDPTKMSTDEFMAWRNKQVQSNSR